MIRVAQKIFSIGRVPLKSLDRYILNQFIGPFAMIITVLTLVIWMTQSLQRIDLVLENGRGIGLFLYITILIIPSLLVILIPFSLFGACLYSFYRMHSDSEIAVIFASGVSRSRVAMPVLAVTFIGALATLYVALDLSPRTYRILKKEILDIRTDFASSVLKSGEFNTVINGFTIYVREVRPNNGFLGLLVSDYRNPNSTQAYMAERGIIRDGPNGPVLVLADGNFQRQRSDGSVQIVPFERTTIDIAAYQQDETLQLEITERYLSELLHPDLSKEWERQNAGKMLAEAHARLACPFHAFAYVLIGVFALIGGAYNRRGYILRIVLAGVSVIVLKVLGFVVQSFSADTGIQWIQYALPISVCFIAIALLFDLVPTLKRMRHDAAMTKALAESPVEG